MKQVMAVVTFYVSLLATIMFWERRVTAVFIGLTLMASHEPNTIPVVNSRTGFAGVVDALDVARAVLYSQLIKGHEKVFR